MEIPIAMIFLSRILKYRANRCANIIAGVITIAYVIVGGSTSPHYVFFATIEVVCILLIVWFAWKWRNPEIAANQQ
jgi:TRAP-type C4-dicarboxylate transport system permease small subunit